MSDWPFEDPPDVAVFTTTGVVKRGDWIAYVCHDEDDGAWQFHSNLPVATEDAAILGFGEILEQDPGLAELADLPYGWEAYRNSPDSPWIRSRKSPKERS